MAVTTTVTTAAKDDMLGKFPSGDVYKIGLIAVGQSLDGTATLYSSLAAGVELATGGGYTAGGATLAGYARTTSGTTVLLDFSDPSWSSATFSAIGCFIYDSTTGRIISVHDFGGTKSVTGGTFTVILPAADASNALVRIS